MLVDTAPTSHNHLPGIFRLDPVIELPEFKLGLLTAITDFSEQEERTSGFELKQETVAVTVLSQAEVGKAETLLKSELKFCVVSVYCTQVFILFLPYIPDKTH